MTTTNNNTDSNEQRFQFINDELPQWFRDAPGVRVEVSSTIALIPGAEPAIPGDWIIRDPDGRIRTESCEEGRIKAREYLINLRREAGL